MAKGIEGLREELARGDLEVGAGAWPALLRALAERVAADAAALAPLEAAWRDRRFPDPRERPLLLLAGLRWRALADPAHPLAPELLLDAAAPDLPARLADALADPALAEALAARRLPRGDATRAIGWGLVALGLAPPHRGLALADLACGAGLALVGDLLPTSWRVGTWQVSGLDLPSPGARLGLDREAAPLDEATARWLRASIWPGDARRREALEAALEGLSRAWPDPPAAPRRERHRLGHDPTDARLAALEEATGLPVLAFQALALAELDADEAAAHAAAMHRWLRGGRRRLWVTLEPAPDDGTLAHGPLALRVHVAVDGAVDGWLVARTDWHPRACHPQPGTLAGLRTLWRERLAADAGRAG